jgi:hypothetical protein
MNKAAVLQILKDISYLDWDFLVSDSPDFWLQVRFFDSGRWWNGRKWRLSEYMTRSEIVQTAFKAILVAEEHETREKFLYKEKPIFNGHIDVDKLLEISDNLDVRMDKTASTD